MGDCRRVDELLTPYADAALPGPEQMEVEQHLSRCPPCRTSAVEETGGRAALRQCAPQLRSEALPPGLRSRCESLAREHCRAHAAGSWRLRLVPIGLATILIAFSGTAILSLATRRSDALLAAQLTADHLKCFKVFTPGGAVVDARRIEAALEERLGGDIHVPPASEEVGLRLVGARQCLYADGRVPHVMYQENGGQPVSLFVLEGVAREETEVVSMGHLCHIWSRGANTYVLVGNEGNAQLARVARYVKTQSH